MVDYKEKYNELLKENKKLLKRADDAEYAYNKLYQEVKSAEAEARYKMREAIMDAFTYTPPQKVYF